MIPNKQKEIFKERMEEENKFIPPKPTEAENDFSKNIKNFSYNASQAEEKPLLNLQLYPEKKYKPPQKQPMNNPNSYKLGFTNDPFNPVQFTNYMQQNYNPPQVIKEYNINLNGFQSNHMRAAMIYEDILPDKISLGNQTSLGERISLYEFLRSVFFPSGDGQNIDVDSQNHKSILSHLKFMDLEWEIEI